MEQPQNNANESNSTLAQWILAPCQKMISNLGPRQGPAVDVQIENPRVAEEAAPAPGMTVHSSTPAAEFTAFSVADQNMGNISVAGGLKAIPDDAATNAYARFKEAGLEPRKREFSVEDYIEHGQPENKCSMAWYQWRAISIVEGKYGRFFFISLVILNGILIGVQADHNDLAPEFFKVAEYVLVSIFILELVMKMFGLGINFWKDEWNVMDFVIIVASVIEIIVEMILQQSTPGLSAFRLIRVLRVIRLVGMLERLSTLAKAFGNALQHVAWVSVLCLVVVYIFAVLGQGLFANSGTLAANPDYKDEWFRTVPRTMLTLFQLMTMDDWANVMRPVGESLPFSWIYTLSFVFVGSLGLMNLITAVFIEELMTQTKLANKKKEEKQRKEKERKLTLCREAIKDFDKNKDGKLSAEELKTVLNEMECNTLLTETFKEVGVPVSSLRAHIAIAEQQKEGYIDIDMLLNMVETASVPTLRRDIFELRFRIFQHERRSLEKMDKLQSTLEDLCAKVGVMDQKVNVFGKFSASAGSK